MIENSQLYDSPVPGSLSLRVECGNDDRKFSDCTLFALGNSHCSSTTALRCARKHSHTSVGSV